MYSAIAAITDPVTCRVRLRFPGCPEAGALKLLNLTPSCVLEEHPFRTLERWEVAPVTPPIIASHAPPLR